MANPLDEAKELDLYGDPDLVREVEPNDVIEDGLVLDGLFYPLYVNGERNPALNWVIYTANAQQGLAVKVK